LGYKCASLQNRRRTIISSDRQPHVRLRHASGINLPEALADRPATNQSGWSLSGIGLQLVESANDFIYTHGLDGRFTYVNSAAVRLTGYTREEILRLSFADLVLPEQRDAVWRILGALSAGQQMESCYLLEIVRKDGARLPMELSTQLVCLEGQPPAVQGIAREINSRRRAEEALRESESKFRALADTAASAIFIYQGTKPVYVNRASELISGYTRDELLNMNFWDVVHPDHQDMVRQRGIARQRGLEAPAEYEFKLRTKGGEERWVHFAAATVPFEGKLAVLGTAFDVTEKMRSDEDLRLQKAYLEQLFESAPEGIVVQDNSGRIIRANREFSRMFGYDPAEILSRPLDDLIAPADKRDEAAALTRYVACGGRFSVETVRQRKDGSLVDVSILGTPVQFEGGQVAVYVIYRDITERKRAEVALIESEAKFRAVADTAAAAIYIQVDERFLFVNRASEAITGYTREELMAMDAFALVHPEHAPMLRARGEARRRGENVDKRYELKIITKQGEERWLDFSAGVIQFVGQQAILGTAFDITQRKRAEQLQSALYRIAERASAAGDLPTFYESIHRILAELLYAKNFYIALYDEAAGLLSWPYFVDEEDESPPEPRGLRRGLTEYVLRTAQPLLATPEVFERLVADGDVEPIGAPSIDWLGVPLKIAERTFGILAVQSYSEHVRFGQKEQEILTFVAQHVAAAIEHKRDQESLRRSELRYRSLFERAAYGIYRSTLDGRLLDVNPALVNMLGYSSPDELMALDVGRDIYVDAEERRSLLLEFQLEGRGIHETRWKRRDGKVITVRLSATVSKDGNGNPEGLELIVEDVTERRALEEQLQHAQKMEAVGRLAGGVAHDFNNLLTVIKGYGELLSQQIDESNPMRTQLDEIRKAADRAATLTRQLLAFSRRQVLAPKILDLNAILSNMEKLLKRLLGEDVELLTVLDPTLAGVKADPGQIEQVVMNLAVNARDAMPDGGQLVVETANVVLDETCQREHKPLVPGRYVMLAVTDTGHGMSDEVRSHVFEPFYTTKERGTGLGLSTVYGIVKQSGGYVWVYSEVGRGSTFKVYLPRVDEIPERRQPHTADPSVYRGSETVLVVEDEDGVRSLVRQMLQRYGYSVLETRNAGEALLVCERHDGPVHMLLTDVVLSQVSGPDLARRLLLMRPNLRVLYMSGYTEDTIVHHGMLKTGIAFLQKPFTTETLARRVREVLGDPDQ
jgi:two-component system cell cycle sensor histidine kinase/response regulator CckA